MIEKIIIDMLNINKNDTKRINHALKVYTYARTIAQIEEVEKNELQIIEISAILHDIGIKECERKYNACGGHLQQKEGPAIAKKILDKYKLDESIKTRILYLIAHHHTYKDINGIDYRILIEADFIVNIQEGNIGKKAFLIAKKKFFTTDASKEIAELAITK